MEYISSDTNVWLDFAVIERLEFPFKLSCIYLMYEEAITNELLSPPKLNQQLVTYGLRGVEITEEEFYLAMEYGECYRKLSVYDRIALSIAKVRNITLLTGDGPLRKAAKRENVHVLGTIGILDRLIEEMKITEEEYLYCLKELRRLNGEK